MQSLHAGDRISENEELATYRPDLQPAGKMISRCRCVDGRGSKHEVLAPVEQFTDGVQVAGMGGGLDQHMHEHGAEVRK